MIDNLRAFIAVDVLNLAIVKLQNDILSAAGWEPRYVKPVEPPNFHFTVIFLGEISDHDVDRIKETLAGFQFEPFTITYTGVGAFPSPAHARVVWVGLDSEGAQKLTALANDVVAKTFELGFKADKPFSAHMTLLRAKRRPVSASYISSKYQGKTFGSDKIDKVHLKKSELRPSGPIYSNIYTVEAKK
jgi:RNA 2',3'-cyclic 3'-phosphodiesterase